MICLSRAAADMVPLDAASELLFVGLGGVNLSTTVREADLPRLDSANPVVLISNTETGSLFALRLSGNVGYRSWFPFSIVTIAGRGQEILAM